MSIRPRTTHRIKVPWVLALFAITTTLRAQYLQWDPVLGVAPENAGHLRPRIAVNGEGRPVVMWSRMDQGCFVAVGEGTGFTAALRLNPDGVAIAAADWQGPTLAASGDTVWAVFKALPEESAPCYLIGSIDGGFTWGDTMRVDPYDDLVSRFPAVAVKSGGDAVVQYMQFTAGYEEPRQVVRAMVIGTWLPVVQVSTPFAPGEVCDCCTGEVVAEGDRVISLYRNASANVRTIWGATSADGGASFVSGAEIDGTAWVAGQCPSSGPDGNLTADSLRYVWMSGSANGTKVYVGSAHAASLDTAARVLLHPGQPSSLQQNFPRIAGSGDTLGIVWEQTYMGQREILFSWSVSGLAGFSAPDTVNTELAGAQRTPDIAYADGAFHIVWSEPITGQVMYRRALLVDDTAIQMDYPSETMRLQYDALDGLMHITGVTVRAVQVYDAEGHRLGIDMVGARSVSLQGLAPGLYVLKVLDVMGAIHAARFVRM